MEFLVSRPRFPRLRVGLFLKSFVSIAALGVLGQASAAMPPMPDWCRQSNPSSSTQCERATIMNPGFLVVDMTSDSRCPASSPAPTDPVYGNRSLASESAAIARIEANWNCYNTVIRGACDNEAAQGQGQWWIANTNTYLDDPSELGDRDWGTVQRNAIKKYKVLASDGQCTVQTSNSNLVERFRPLACQPGFILSMVTLSDGYSWPICTKTTPTCSGGRCQEAEINPKVGNPIDITGSSKHATETDFQGTGKPALEFTRRYNSSIAPETGTTRLFRSIGHTWRTNFDRRLSTYAGPAGKTGVRADRPDGSSLFYLVDAAGVVTRNPSDANTLVKETTGWKLRLPDDVLETYDLDGKLLSIAERSGAAIVIAYDAQGRMATATDPLGRSIAFSYGASDFISGVTLPDGSTVGYAYDSFGRLT